MSNSTTILEGVFKLMGVRFEDAERDCTTALGFSIDHIKSLYRRAIALKGLERYTEALDGTSINPNLLVQAGGVLMGRFGKGVDLGEE